LEIGGAKREGVWALSWREETEAVEVVMEEAEELSRVGEHETVRLRDKGGRRERCGWVTGGDWWQGKGRRRDRYRRQSKETRNRL
jgi:hypothetical protein